MILYSQDQTHLLHVLETVLRYSEGERAEPENLKFRVRCWRMYFPDEPLDLNPEERTVVTGALEEYDRLRVEIEEGVGSLRGEIENGD